MERSEEKERTRERIPRREIKRSYGRNQISHFVSKKDVETFKEISSNFEFRVYHNGHGPEPPGRKDNMVAHEQMHTRSGKKSRRDTDGGSLRKSMYRTINGSSSPIV